MTYQEDIEQFKKDPDLTKYFALIKKYGAPYQLSDRGQHYFKDLLSKYMQGLPLNDDKLFIILGLNTYGSKLDDTGLETDVEIIREIQEKMGVAPEDDGVINNILGYLYQSRYLEDNPNYVEEANQSMRHYQKKYLEQPQ